MTNNVAKAEYRDRKRFREYKRNQSDNDGWEAEKRASYNDDPSSMSDSQLIKQHNELLRLQKQEFQANHDHMAKDMAKRRNKLWKEARKRGIENELQ